MLKLFLLLNPIYVTLFWAWVLNTNRTEGNEPKMFLGKFMIVAFLLYSSHLFYFMPQPDVYHYIDPFYHLLNMLLYPMYYVYIRLLTIDRSFSLRRHSVFFIAPVVMFLLYGSGVLAMSKAEHIDYLYGMLLSEEKLSGIFLYQKTVYTLCRAVFIGQGISYMLLASRLVRTNRNALENYYANTAENRLDKIQLLNISLLITIISGIVLSVLGKESFMENIESGMFFPFLVLSVMLFFLGWLGNKQRSVLTTDEHCQTPVSLEQKQDKISVNAEQLSLIKQKLLRLFEEEKIFLNKDLTIWDVANVLGTNRTYISMIINNDLEQNFSAFVNSYRVKYAQSLLESNPNIGKQNLVEMSGFGSVASMKRAFSANETVRS